MTGPILDTGRPALWSPAKRLELGRCMSCEWHPEAQGHHPDCPVPMPEHGGDPDLQDGPAGPDPCDWFAAGVALPPAPAPCRICGVEMTPKRAGQFDRCEPCWADLLASQPTETRGGDAA